MDAEGLSEIENDIERRVVAPGFKAAKILDREACAERQVLLDYVPLGSQALESGAKFGLRIHPGSSRPTAPGARENIFSARPFPPKILRHLAQPQPAVQRLWAYRPLSKELGDGE